VTRLVAVLAVAAMAVMAAAIWARYGYSWLYSN
jgi:hypothetical protein